MSKVILQGHILVPNADLDAVIEALPTHVELTRAEAGCLIFDVVQDETEPNKFHVFEEFVDQAAFTAHQARVRNSQWGAITQDVERFYHITESDE